MRRVGVRYPLFPFCTSGALRTTDPFLWLVLNSGMLMQTRPLPVLGDVAWEPYENFYLLLAQPQNAVLCVDEGTATILNDDPLPMLNARRNSGNLVLSWLGEPYPLQGSTNPSEVDIPMAASPYTNSIEIQPGGFFRFRA
jgi:hypothetical protein